ncbi:MAG TPA: hypothetical protein VKS01_01520 [Bryobacteraceae bacterium]|nr:hypothetical protein [Bryobacteraceae bacterium]
MRIGVSVCLALTVAFGLHAQVLNMTSDQVVAFIKSSLKLHLDGDAKIAAYVKKIKLSDKLDERRVEELQGLGAGPRTIAALRALSDSSVSLPPPPPPAPVAPRPTIPPPSSIEQAAILHEIVENARNYAKGLPDYMCIQVTRRHIDPTATENWRTYDTVQEQVSYVDHKENYQVVAINGNAVKNVEHQRLGGSTLSGDFGTIYTEIFAVETATEFDWDHWATLRGKRMYVFAFHVPQSRSKFTIYDQESNRTVTAGYRGLIYADRDTKLVMRYKFECEDLPHDFPVKAVGLDVNYEYIDIAGAKYVLPLKTEVKSTATTERGKIMTWNEAEFHLYRKFGTASSITFDTPDPIPDDQLKEQPPVPDAKDKKPGPTTTTKKPPQ